MMAVSTMPSCQPATVRLMPSRAIEPFIAMYRGKFIGHADAEPPVRAFDSRRVTRPTRPRGLHENVRQSFMAVQGTFED